MKTRPRALIALTLGFIISLSLIQRSPAAKAAPLDLSGEIDGAPYRIRVPEVWNGTFCLSLRTAIVTRPTIRAKLIIEVPTSRQLLHWKLPCSLKVLP